jgi:hypothetical protein
MPLPEPVPDGERTGVLIGTGVGGFEVADANMVILRSKGSAASAPLP